MNITSEVNMTFTHSVLHMGVRLYKCLPL